jgi:hypothetical protein
MCLGPDGNGKKQTIPLTEKLCLLDCSRENRNASNESFFFPFRLSACFFFLMEVQCLLILLPRPVSLYFDRE